MASLWERMMNDARKQAVLKMNCNGNVDCQASHHLICCLSKEK